MAIHRHFYCPHCSAHVAYKIGDGHSSVGPASEKCPACGEQYATGLTEWKDMTQQQKFAYYLSSPWRLLGALLQGGFLGLVAAIGISFIGFNGNPPESFMIAGIVIGAGVGALLWGKELKEDISDHPKA